jgi:suppressor of ftsI/bilirubin oxidase
MAGPSDSCLNHLPTRRRNVLKALSALGICAAAAALSDDRISTRSAAHMTFAAPASAQPLFIPGASGLFGRLAPDGAPLRMRASTVAARPGALAYLVEHRGSRFVNPTLILRHGERVRIDFDNALRESTIVHWHGLAVDTRNDGAGMTLAAPGERYAYDFEVRDRGALYWYHPHPHGMTAAQAYRGLFGMLEVEDEDERRLRSALDLMPGKTEIPLVLQDRRGNDYRASDADRMHGFLGDAVYINGTACPYLDVASRI